MAHRAAFGAVFAFVLLDRFLHGFGRVLRHAAAAFGAEARLRSLERAAGGTAHAVFAQRGQLVDAVDGGLYAGNELLGHFLARRNGLKIRFAQSGILALEVAAQRIEIGAQAGALPAFAGAFLNRAGNAGKSLSKIIQKVHAFDLLYVA